jgi:predicted MFS family arabinose efflux permease
LRFISAVFVPKEPLIKSSDQPKALPPASLAWTIWGLGAALYFIAFYQRVAPAVITAELTSEFALTAASLGNLSAFYFYSYVAMQIPTGILADRWGPRLLLTIGAGVAAAGTLVFSLAPTLWWADIGRLLIGASVGVAFVCMLKLASHWMRPRQFALASGMALFVGVVGAVCAGAPLRILVDAFGWRAVMRVSAAITLALTLAIWWVVRDDPRERGFDTHYAGRHDGEDATHFFSGLIEVFRYRNTTLLFLVPGAISAVVLSFAGLWGVPFLVTHYQLGKTHAAGLCSLMMVAWALSGLAYGAASDRLGRRKPLFIAGVAATMALWSVLVFVPGLPYGALVALIVALGSVAGAFILVFAFAKESVPARLSGTISGIVNMGVMTGAMIMQPLIGWTLDRNWTGGVANGIRVYDFAAYQNGFALALAWGAVAIVMLAFTRETYCRQAP